MLRLRLLSKALFIWPPNEVPSQEPQFGLCLLLDVLAVAETVCWGKGPCPESAPRMGHLGLLCLLNDMGPALKASLRNKRDGMFVSVRTHAPKQPEMFDLNNLDGSEPLNENYRAHNLGVRCGLPLMNNPQL